MRSGEVTDRMNAQLHLPFGRGRILGAQIPRTRKLEFSADLPTTLLILALPLARTLKNANEEGKRGPYEYLERHDMQ